MLAHKSELRDIINPHRWLEPFPNHPRPSQIRKSMSELSRMMDKHANPKIWRESHGGWVGVMSPKIELFFY